MSHVKIRAALEERLNALTPAIATAWENVPFIPPSDAPYQRVNLVPARPENPTLGGTFVRELGFLQVTLMYQLTKGPGVAEARAQLVREHFPRGLSLTKDGITVHVSNTPYILAGSPDGDRWSVPVRVFYHANIS